MFFSRYSQCSGVTFCYSELSHCKSSEPLDVAKGHQYSGILFTHTDTPPLLPPPTTAAAGTRPRERISVSETWSVRCCHSTCCRKQAHAAPLVSETVPGHTGAQGPEIHPGFKGNLGVMRTLRGTLSKLTGAGGPAAGARASDRRSRSLRDCGTPTGRPPCLP